MAQSMAFQNATWLIETAKAGHEDGFRMFGHSLIVAPTGEIAAKSQSEEDEVICHNCDIDLAANLKQTMFNFAAHRRPEHYRLIVERGVANCAPFSFFNVISEEPPLCILSFNPRSDGAMKHTLKNIRRTSEFVVNLADEGTANAMHASAAEIPESDSEFTRSGLTPVPARTVQHPRIGEAAASLECRLERRIEFGPEREMVVGEILLVHAREGIIDPATKRISEQPYRPVWR